jgi:hypothetical protein
VGIAIGIAIYAVITIACMLFRRDNDQLSRWDTDRPVSPLPYVANAGTPGGAANRADVIAHFRCPCNSCEIDELAACDCPHPGGAQEVKGFIDEAISLNRYSSDEIVALVESRYGGKIR